MYFNVEYLIWLLKKNKQMCLGLTLPRKKTLTRYLFMLPLKKLIIYSPYMITSKEKIIPTYPQYLRLKHRYFLKSPRMTIGINPYKGVWYTSKFKVLTHRLSFFVLIFSPYLKSSNCSEALPTWQYLDFAKKKKKTFRRPATMDLELYLQ